VIVNASSTVRTRCSANGSTAQSVIVIEASARPSPVRPLVRWRSKGARS